MARAPTPLACRSRRARSVGSGSTGPVKLVGVVLRPVARRRLPRQRRTSRADCSRPAAVRPDEAAPGACRARWRAGRGSRGSRRRREGRAVGSAGRAVGRRRSPEQVAVHGGVHARVASVVGAVSVMVGSEKNARCEVLGQLLRAADGRRRVALVADDEDRAGALTPGSCPWGCARRSARCGSCRRARRSSGPTAGGRPWPCFCSATSGGVGRRPRPVGAPHRDHRLQVGARRVVAGDARARRPTCPWRGGCRPCR